MDDLAERLRQIERNPSPDLWDEIRSRPVDAAPAERRSLGHRIAAGLVAAIVSIAALAFLVTVFRSEPDRDEVGTPSSPLTIRVRTTNDPFDVHFSATFRDEDIDLVGIETPGPDLEYPNSTPADLPVGTPIVIDTSDGTSVSVFELDPAQGKSVVEDGSCLIPGSLRALPGPDETAFFIYAEGKGWSSGQAFGAETVGEELDHDSALDPNSTVDASKLGLATCDVDPSLLVSSSGPSGDQAYLSGTLTTENGCVAVQTGPALSIYVVWPQGYSLAREGGETWLVDDSGNRIAAIGDVIQMGGGITDLAHAEPSVTGGIPSSCEVGGPDAYWFAGTPDLVGPSPPASEAEATRMPGIDAYKVCRVLSLPGDFGDAGDEVVVFEEERVPTAGCVGSEGFQHVAVLRDGRVRALSRRITDIVGDDAYRVWPYATPDLTGDGVDEIAVTLHWEGRSPRVWFFMLSPGGGGIEPIYEPGAVPDLSRTGAFTRSIASGIYAGTFRPQGVYCEGEGDARRIVTWEASRDDLLDVVETRWRLLSTELEFVSESTIHIGERVYPDAGDLELCGSPVSPLDSYPSAMEGT